MSGFHDLSTGVRVVAYSHLKKYPALFLPIARWRENYKKRVVHPQAELVLEAFTRSGSHPALFTFLVAQGRTVDVAHHFHAPAPLMLAARWNLPALLPVREPVATIASAAMYFNVDCVWPFLRSYINFYAPLKPYADALVISDFPTTVGNFPAVVAALNEKFGRSFKLPTGSPEERAEVERRIRAEHHENMGAVATTLPLPTPEKEAIKHRFAERLQQPRYARRLDECRRLHAWFAERGVGSSS